MKKVVVYFAAVLLICVSENRGGEIFAFSFSTHFSKRQLPPDIQGNWLLLGLDSIIPVNISLKKSYDEFNIKINRQLAGSDSSCNSGKNIVVRNIEDVLPGRLSIAKEDSIDDSTWIYYTDKDSIRVIKKFEKGIFLSFASGSKKQVVVNEGFESAYVIFTGDINKDNRLDFVISWQSDHANLFEIYISRIAKEGWQLKKEGEIKFMGE